MSEVLITSSVLILALLLLRWLFRNCISCTIRYALWVLVLIRLLVPVTLPALGFSVLTMAGPANHTVSNRLESVAVFDSPMAQMDTFMNAPQAPDAGMPAWTVKGSSSNVMPNVDIVEGYSVLSENQSQNVWYAGEVSLQQLLTYLWYAGMAIMVCWLVISNVRFGRMLIKARVAYPVPGCRYPVYMLEQGLCSPCLFGFLKPAIYLTPAAIKNEATLRHVITHETTHGAHLDLLWSFLRSACLVVYWFDPLVWIAAKASEIDCELACDEGTMKRLGEEERLAYGQTLLSLITVRRSSDPLLSATTMTSDKKRLKDRILRIAENRKTKAAALAAVLLAVTVICILTFTGARKEEAPASENPSGVEETKQAGQTLPPEEKGEPAILPLSGDTPKISMVLPEGEPTLTIPLDNLAPIRETKVEIECVSDDCAERGGAYQLPFAGLTTRSYLSDDGNIYAAIVYEEVLNEQGLLKWEAGRFFKYPAGMELSDCRMTTYESLFGFPAVAVQYPGQYPNGTYGSCCNIYGLDSGAGDLYFLTTFYGNWPQQMDLNGDGSAELVASGDPSAQLLFRNGDKMYQVDIGVVLQDTWPELQSWNYTVWDESRQALLCNCTASMPQWGENAYANCVREIYFDGEKLLVYPQLYGTVDHISDAVPMDAYPECVYEAAKNLAQTAYEASKNNEEGMMQDQGYDDWRVTALRLVQMIQEYGMQLEVYETDYAFHASIPGSVVLAGGACIGEDGWVSGFYREQSPYLIFQRHEDGSRIRLESCIPMLSSPGSAAYDGNLYVSLLKSDLIQLSELTGEHQLAMFLGLRNLYLNLLGEYDPAQWQGAAQQLVSYCQGAEREKQRKELEETLYWLVPSAWTKEGQAVYEYIQSLLAQ